MLDLEKFGDRIFLHESGHSYSYNNLITEVHKVSAMMKNQFVIMEAENNYQTFSRFIGLLKGNNKVFLCPSYQFNDSDYLKLIETETKTNYIKWSRTETLNSLNLKSSSNHPLLEKEGAFFLVRTSGSSGKKFKFVLHDPELFFKKYQTIGPHFRKTIAFSPAESIAGIETLLEVITHGNELVASGDRLSPLTVCEMIEKFNVDYFQTTPTFLNLLAMSGTLVPANLTSLKKIAYGSEPSQKTILANLSQKLPWVEFMHTYGMSEIGIQKTVTSKDDATLFRINNDFNPARLKDGMIEIKSMTPMIGYLNAATTLEEGWFKTFDIVSPEGDYWRVVGRNSDLINLAGRKFYPSEVEELIMLCKGVNDVTIVPDRNDIIGTYLIANISIAPEIDEALFRKDFKQFCTEKIPFYMHPQKIKITKSSDTSARFKKIRRL